MDQLTGRLKGKLIFKMEKKQEIIIGLEIHIQLDTKTKLFCNCSSTGKKDKPNSRTCEICLGHPGSKPVLNKEALNYGLRLAMALECQIASELIFSRKSYFYPDLAKNFQISQFEKPLGEKGKVLIETKTKPKPKTNSGKEKEEGGEKEIRIKRVHLEEDPAALIHPGGLSQGGLVLIDYNRSGNPLAEVVTEPDLNSPAEARNFLSQLLTILNYLRIFDKEKGIIKADANISLREKNYQRVEIKNITGFKEIERALNYEVERQKKEEVVQETRMWDPQLGATKSLRKKEIEEEYGYIIEPDLVPIRLDQELIEEVKKGLPELAEEKRKRLVKEYKIAETDARVIAQEKLLAELFEKVAAEIDPKLVASWLRKELVRVMNFNEITFNELKLDEGHLIDLLGMVERGEITPNVAKKILEKLAIKPFDVKKYVQKENLGKVADKGELENICQEVIGENKEAVQDYLKGEEKALHFLMGKVMQKTRGQADPGMVVKELERLLKE